MENSTGHCFGSRVPAYQGISPPGHQVPQHSSGSGPERSQASGSRFSQACEGRQLRLATHPSGDACIQCTRGYESANTMATAESRPRRLVFDRGQHPTFQPKHLTLESICKKNKSRSRALRFHFLFRNMHQTDNNWPSRVHWFVGLLCGPVYMSVSGFALPLLSQKAELSLIYIRRLARQLTSLRCASSTADWAIFLKLLRCHIQCLIKPEWFIRACNIIPTELNWAFFTSAVWSGPLWALHWISSCSMAARIQRYQLLLFCEIFVSFVLKRVSYHALSSISGGVLNREQTVLSQQVPSGVMKGLKRLLS